MNTIREFLNQTAPKSGKEMTIYFRNALGTAEVMLAVYFFLAGLLISQANCRIEWIPFLFCIAAIGVRWSNGKINSLISFHAFELLIVFWCLWHIRYIGWSCGSQHLLIPMLMLCFFNIYEPPWAKIFSFLLALALRLGMFAYSLNHEPLYKMSDAIVYGYQTLNTLMLFSFLLVNLVTFSSSIQASERQLIINNQALHKEAGTDALTQLPNRRALLNEVEIFRKDNPDAAFSVAIADIDFFKKVNDTYGHNCGDYTLRTLAALFRDSAQQRYHVCRWGGEEFCFFLPKMNIDEAGVIMQDLNFAVKKMPLHYGDIDFSITITVGVEENDFRSSMEQIFDQADRKLYMGKANGRDQVVI